MVRHMPNQQMHLDRVFRALGDPTRRAVLSRLSAGSAAVSELARSFDMALPSFTQHLDVLEQSGLVRSRAVQRFSPAKPQRCVTGGSSSRPTPAIAKAKRIPWRLHRRFLCENAELLPTARGECRSQPSD